MSTVPPPPSNCAVEVSQNVLTASWDRPDTNCLLGPYSVNWTHTKLWGDEEETSGSSNTSGTKLDISNPVSYSQYSFEVKASIDGVFGNPVSIGVVKGTHKDFVKNSVLPSGVLVNRFWGERKRRNRSKCRRSVSAVGQ